MTTPARPTETAEIREALAAVTPAMLKAAWGAWHARHGGRLGPGPAFTEALAAGLAVYRAATAQADRTAGELAAAEAEKARLKAQVEILLKVIDAGKVETAFAYADEADGSATATTRRIRLENINCALKGVGDIEARKALGLLVETIDGDLTRAALTEEPPHAAE